MSDVDGGTCWQCGTKAERITELQAKVEEKQNVIHDYAAWVVKMNAKHAQYEAVIDAARAVANSYYGTETEEFEPVVDALSDTLAALRDTK